MERDELIALGIEEAVADRIMEEQDAMRRDFDERLREERNEHEIEKILTGSGARNIKAVRALIEATEAEDVAREIERLKSDEETRFLFEKKGSFAPYRGAERLPDTKKSTFEERLNAARRAGDTLEAIRVKQQAASEGVMLI